LGIAIAPGTTTTAFGDREEKSNKEKRELHGLLFVVSEVFCDYGVDNFVRAKKVLSSWSF
jgi:hypothetical protein